jgi:hypothetical protein
MIRLNKPTTQSPDVATRGRGLGKGGPLHSTLEATGFPNIHSGHGFAPSGTSGYTAVDTTAALGFIVEAVEI